MYSTQYFHLILTKSVFSQQIFIEVPSIKCQENLSSGSQADIYGWMDGWMDGQT
jgi:hypothetical protein